MQITRANTWLTRLVGASFLGLAISAQAQVAPASSAASANPVLKGAHVTEDALVDALAIEPANTGASGAMRGFRPSSKPGGTPVKVGPGRASLLITFATNSTELGSDTQGQVDTLARALQSDTLAGFSFRVEGHADSRGEAGSNQRLSQQRAEAVMAYLTSKHGILPERLTAVGKGSSEPMNAARVDAPENRRVTIVTVRN